MSEYEERVIAEITRRAERGLNKYGVAMERDDLSVAEWLQHAKEEALDLAVYLERLIACANKILEIKQYAIERGILEFYAGLIEESELADIEFLQFRVDGSHLRELAQMIEDL